MPERKSSVDDVKNPQTSEPFSPNGKDGKNKMENNKVPYGRFQEVVGERNELREQMEVLKSLEGSARELEYYRKAAESMAKEQMMDLAREVGTEKLNDAVEAFDLERMEPIEKLEKLPKLKKMLMGKRANARYATGGAPVPMSAGKKPSRLEELRRKNDKKGLNLREKKEYLRLLRETRG